MENEVILVNASENSYCGSYLDLALFVRVKNLYFGGGLRPMLELLIYDILIQ